MVPFDLAAPLPLLKLGVMMVPAGNKPRHEEWQRGGAAGPRCVVESHPQNQDPAGAGGEGRGRQPVQSALCNTDQVFQTGTTSSIDSHGPVLIQRSKGFWLRSKCENILLEWKL